MQGVQHRMVLVVNIFRTFEINFFGFVVALFDLVQDLEAIHGLYVTANSILKSFLKYE